MNNEEGLVAPDNLIGAVPLGYDDKYIRNDLMNLVEENNIYLLPALTTLNIYNLLLALGITPNRKYNRSLYMASFGGKKYQYGILELEIPYKPSTWLEKITGKNWNHRYNPILLKNKTWIYHIDEVRASTINKTLKIIRKEKKNGKRVWKKLYPQLLELFDENTIKDSFNRMIDDDRYTVALIGWQNHMRFLYKNSDRRSISFFDPWMQTLDKQLFFHNIQNSLEDVYGYSSQFIRRKEDQSEENSCVIDSLARALMVAEYGDKAAKWEWNENTYDYALLAARIIHINME